MTVDEVIDELAKRYGYTRMSTQHVYQRVTPQQLNDDLLSWCRATGLSSEALLNEIARVLASEYHNGRMTYEFCDMAVNKLVRVPLEAPTDSLFWQVFLAFDAGEYQDRESTTDVEIARIVSAHGSTS